MTTRRNVIANYVILGFFAISALYPIVAIMLVALHDPSQPVTGFAIPSHPELHNFVRAWDIGHFSQFLRSSAIVAVAVVAVSSVLSILAGYAFGAFRFRGDTALFYLLLLGLIMPYEAVIVPLYFDFRSLGLTDTYWSLILPQLGFSLPFGIFWMRAFFLSVPRSLIEASRIDGASTFQTLWRVLLPFGWPAVLTMVVITFMWTWNEFLLPLVMISQESHQTAPLGLAFFQYKYTTDVPGVAAASVIIAAPIVLIYILLQRHFISGMLSGAVKG
jgi:raffinose/stachyose/melibiose transport system permease protein